jgi:hypothetical protein
MIGPGVRYTHVRRESGPVEIHVVEIDGSSAYIRPSCAPARPEALALEPVSRIAARAAEESRYPIAAVNGDYFIRAAGTHSNGDPVGVAVWDGEILSTPGPANTPRSALILDAQGTSSIAVLKMDAWAERGDGERRTIFAANQSRGSNQLVLYTPRFGASTGTRPDGVEVVLGDISLPVRAGARLTGTVRFVVRGAGDAAIPPDGVVLSGQGTAAEFLRDLTPGDSLAFRLDFAPGIPDGANVIGGGPRLVRAGRTTVEWEAEGLKPDVTQGRAPRTAVGCTGRRLVIVAVDGRQPGYSVGMTLTELADFMRELGCADAMNLDGGGSSCMWVRGAVQNRPSDGRERPVANALMVFCSAPKGPPVRLTLAPAEISLLAGTALPLQLRGEDAFYNPLEVPPGGVEWEVDPALGSVDADGRFVAAGGTEGALWKSGLLWAKSGEARIATRVRVYRRPPRLEITPAGISVATGGTKRLEVRAYDESGRPLTVPAEAVRWEVAPEIGVIDADGTLRASDGRGRGTVVATLYGVRATSAVSVGTVVRPLDGFETSNSWTATTFPPAVPGTVTLASEHSRTGSKALKLTFDFSTTTATRAVYARAPRPIGTPLALRLWLQGDPAGAWLRARLRDAAGQVVTVDFGRNLEAIADWRELIAPIPDGTAGPLTLESIYVVQPDPTMQTHGEIYVDDLSAEYAGS